VLPAIVFCNEIIEHLMSKIQCCQQSRSSHVVLPHVRSHSILYKSRLVSLPFVLSTHASPLLLDTMCTLLCKQAFIHLLPNNNRSSTLPLQNDHLKQNKWRCDCNKRADVPRIAPYRLLNTDQQRSMLLMCVPLIETRSYS
jgi:hypothetical protein